MERQIPAQYQQQAEEIGKRLSATVAPHLPAIYSAGQQIAAMSDALRNASSEMASAMSRVSILGESVTRSIAFKAQDEFMPTAIIPATRERVVLVRHDEPREMRMESRQFNELLKTVTVREVSEHQTMRLPEDQFNALIAQKAPQEMWMDLFYDREVKELYRHVQGRRFVCIFSDKEDNKRILLVEKLLASRKYVLTSDLAEYLGCTQKAVQNLVQAINAKIDGDLHLPENFIRGNRGSGYCIDRFYCVYPATR
ncbi:HTH domain-containing protein [Patescibacteria group bacterium]|nr:HTH domain-containing protein [Patescibacteria group bacterium]